MFGYRRLFGPRFRTQCAVDPSSAQMSNFLLIEALCVDARRSSMRASDCIAHCIARTAHERERIMVWVAFLGRWQLPIDVFITKEIETALFSPLRGDVPMPAEVPYMMTVEVVRADLMQIYLTLGSRMGYLARQVNEQAITEALLRRFLDELSGAGRLCRFLERQLGLALDVTPWPVRLLTAEI